MALPISKTMLFVLDKSSVVLREVFYSFMQEVIQGG